MKTLQGKLALFFSSRPVLAYLHVFFTLFDSLNPNLAVLLNVTKLFGVGSVNLSHSALSSSITGFLLTSSRQKLK